MGVKAFIVNVPLSLLATDNNYTADTNLVLSKTLLFT